MPTLVTYEFFLFMFDMTRFRLIQKVSLALTPLHIKNLFATKKKMKRSFSDYLKSSSRKFSSSAPDRS